MGSPCAHKLHTFQLVDWWLEERPGGVSTLQIMAETCAECLLFDTHFLAAGLYLMQTYASLCLWAAVQEDPCAMGIFSVVQFNLSSIIQDGRFEKPPDLVHRQKQGRLLAAKNGFPCLKIGFASHIFLP